MTHQNSSTTAALMSHMVFPCKVTKKREKSKIYFAFPSASNFGEAKVLFKTREEQNIFCFSECK